LTDIDEFVTDASADPATLSTIAAAGVTVTVADTGPPTRPASQAAPLIRP
jgi:hypothetical protein